MRNLHKHRFRSTRVISLVSMMIVGGSMARAEIGQLTTGSASSARFSPALASCLALLPRQVTRETTSLRVDLVREKRQARLAAAERKGWKKDYAASGQKIGASAPPPTTSAGSPPVVRSSSADWYAIAECESGGVWNINTGNGYWGGLQFSSTTWFAYGGGPFSGTGPFPYSASQQIAVAERVLDAQGPSAWPSCFRWA